MMEQPEIGSVAEERPRQNSIVRFLFSSPAVYGWVSNRSNCKPDSSGFQ